MAKIKNVEKHGDIINGHSKPLIVDHILFSFKYITKNKKHSFNYFCTDMRKAHKAYEALFQKMNKISIITMTQLLGLRKDSGVETLSYSRFNSSMQEILGKIPNITSDSKFMVFRFCNGCYRMICKPDETYQNILHIIGFDFDYSAYTH